MCQSTGAGSSESKKKDDPQPARTLSGPSVWDAITCNPPSTGCIDATQEVVIWATGPVTRFVGGIGSVLRALGLGGSAARGIAPQIAKVEKQLAQHGRGSVEKSLRSLEKRLAEHRQALETYRAQGGYTSSVEREIRAFESEIQAIKDVLGRGP